MCTADQIRPAATASLTTPGRNRPPKQHLSSNPRNARCTAEKKPQVPPLRYAPVGMTILFRGARNSRRSSRGHIELSSRPERSVVEGPAVSFPLGIQSLLCGARDNDCYSPARDRIWVHNSLVPKPVLLEHNRSSLSPNPSLSRATAFGFSLPESLSALVPTTSKLRPIPLRAAINCWSLACTGILLSTRQIHRTRLARSSK